MDKSDQQKLKDLFEYRPETGEFIRRVQTSPNAPVGAAAGTDNAKGYRMIHFGGQQYGAGRLAWLYMTGEWPARNIVFIDGDKTNAAWGNLRLAGDLPEPSAERLREIYDYDPQTGHLIFRRNTGGTGLKGQVSGSICRRTPQRGGGYRLMRFNGREWGAHHLVWLWHHGRVATGHIDHINRDRADNRIENLRECTASQNLMNRPKQSTNTSGYKGVATVRSTGRWRATLQNKHLGCFDTPEEAFEAYKAAATAKFGDFALNE